MKRLLFFLLLIISFILQISGKDLITINQVTPNLVLLLVLILVLFKGFDRSWWIVLIAGFVLDSYSGIYFGTFSFALIGSAYFVDLLNEKLIATRKNWLQMVLVLVGLLFFFFVLWLLSLFVNFEVSFRISHILTILIYHFVIASALMYGAKKIYNSSS